MADAPQAGAPAKPAARATEIPKPQPEDVKRAENLVASYQKIKTELSKLIVGQDQVIEQLLIAVLAKGHCLLEGVPGLAKTLMVRGLSQVMTLSFRRIQFTPDLMPADITGTDIIQEDPQTGRRVLNFQKGPIFAQMILADEINRTPPKTQAALLEAMQEHSVTVGGKTYPLEEPFFVLATQNPIEQEGTYPLPEAQKDRFMFLVKVDYPQRDEEREIVNRTTGAHSAKMEGIISGAEIMACQETVRKVLVPDHVMDFVLDVVRKTRPKDPGVPAFVKELVEWGAGPRACQQWVLGGKVRAVLQGRFHVTLDDMVALATPVLRHRIVPTFNAEAEGVTVDEIIQKILDATLPHMAQLSEFLTPADLQKISNLQVLARLVVEGFCTGLHRSPHKGFSVEFKQHRQYVHGDEIRHLDWRVFGKTDRFYIREYEEETNLRCTMLLDASGSMNYGNPQGRSKLVYAQRLAACLAYLMMGQQDSVGLVTFDTKVRRYIPPRAQTSHLKVLVNELEATKPGGETELADVFHDLVPRLHRRGLIVILSDCFGDVQKLLSALAHMRHARHEIVIFQIWDRTELEFDFRSWTRFDCLEVDGKKYLVDPNHLRGAYLENLEQFRAELKQGCHRHRIDLVPVVTDQPYAEALAQYLTLRMRR